MFYKYDFENAIAVPEPFKRYITPIFMGDDAKIKGCTFSLHMTEWEPGCMIDKHSHPDATEAMFCISGSADITIGGESHKFTPGCLMVAEPNVEHQLINTGEEMLRVFCVFSPPITAQGLRERAMGAVDASKEK